MDCGLFQGYKLLRLRNWTPLPIAPDQVCVVHGELGASDELRKRIKHELGWARHGARAWLHLTYLSQVLGYA